MKGVHVTNEVGKLRKVLLHRPGKELLNLTPDSLKELLFDDIPYLDNAIKEHDEFAKVLKEHGIEVVYLEDLMAEVFDMNYNSKIEFIEQFIDEANLQSYQDRGYVYQYLMNFSNHKDLVLKTMEGIRVNEIPEMNNHITDNFITKPMPNLYYTRDNFASVGNGIHLNHMYSETRNRECIYAEYIFKYHPNYKDVEKYYNRNYPWHIEGGDVLILNNHTVAIGISERTEINAIKQLAKNYFNNPNCDIDIVLAFHIPPSRAFMHLDTVFTQVDKYSFTYHPGIIDTLQVFEIKEGNDFNTTENLKITEINDSLDIILEKYLNHSIKLIPCAGGDKIAAEREQWSDGSNTLCIAPGVVIAYDRNKITNEALKKEGIKVIEIPSSELSRGRGGPRCMSMPLIRDELEKNNEK